MMFLTNTTPTKQARKTCLVKRGYQQIKLQYIVVGMMLHSALSHLRKFPQIFAVSMGVVLGIMRILCIPFKILLFG